ncbi:MAG: ABC transporter ATP-binding protein [Bacteroides sp.]|nr:ABC transporter ATP-binding protein [Bacillota bacterium]MCM1393354.1 ABC transporter ATP-binding protein [[Eubacterium] siraeum]MCM1454908.1 ABC transporter ATP-binding protein [Bacteroides sp.]
MSDINIENLKIAYGDNVVFDGFSAKFPEGKISVVLGGSGVGKSTLLNAIAGLLPYDGRIDLNGGRVSYIFQNDRLIPAISVYKNLDLILRAVFKDKSERRKRIENMLELLEISDLAHKLPTELSGGQAQRVAMARAYLYPSEVLLLDEPFKALDTALKTRLIKQLVSLHERENRTVLFVTHAIDECLLVADEFFVLAGSPVEVSLRGEIASDKATRRLDDDDLANKRDILLKNIMSL